MRLDQEINVSELPESSGSYDPLPEGWYQVSIKAAEIKPTKDGSGQYIKVQYAVLGPTHQGRVVFGNLNIRNASAKAEEIGRQQLGELMRSIGLSRVSDTDQLVGGNLQIKLSIRKQEGYEPSNEVKGFKALEGNLPATAAKPAAEPGAAKKLPWAK